MGCHALEPWVEERAVPDPEMAFARKVTEMTSAELEVLVRAHQAELFRYLRYLGIEGPEGVEDLVQETFLAAFRGRESPPLGDSGRSAAWLRGIARNLFLQHCQRRARGPLSRDPAALEDAEVYWQEGFLRGGDGFETVEALRGCLERLEEKPRRLLDLFYRQKKTRVELATLFAMSENGIKSLLQRVRGGLAECIERRLRVGGT